MQLKNLYIYNLKEIFNAGIQIESHLMSIKTNTSVDIVTNCSKRHLPKTINYDFQSIKKREQRLKYQNLFEDRVCS